MIVALAKKGGVIQINFDCGYLNPDAWRSAAAQMAKLGPTVSRSSSTKYANDPAGHAQRACGCPLKANVIRVFTRPWKDVVKHINHVVDIAGIGAVGLGSDFDGVACVPEDLNGVDKWPNLT